MIIRKTQLSFEWSNEDQSLKIGFLLDWYWNIPTTTIGGFFTCVQIRCVCFYIHTTITVWTMESDVLIWGIKAVPPVTVLKRRKSGSSNYTSPGFVVNRAVYMSAVKREYHKKYQPKRKSHSQLLCQSTDILRSSYWVVLYK